MGGPIFFSPLRRAIADPKAPSAALGAAWAGFLAARPGVKADELKWTGLDEFLVERRTQRVTKREIDDFLRRNAVEVREVVAGGGERLTPEQKRRLADWVLDNTDMDDMERVDPEGISEEASRGNGEAIGALEQLGAPDEFLDPLHSEHHPRPTRYGNFTLPGGEHYRELLLTLPDRPPTFDEWMERVKVNNPPRFEAFTADPERARSAYQGAVRDNVAGDSIGFRSPHFDEVNVVVHVRFNERTSVDGLRVLFIEELQSDWAQTGRQKGFREASPTALPHGYYVTHERWPQEGGRVAPVGYSGRWRNITVLRRPDGSEAQWAQGKNLTLEDLARRHPTLIANELYRLRDQGAPAPGPFVGSTEKWTELALKRMVRWAAEHGFDRLAWTTGDQQAARYDLSTQIERIVAVKDRAGFDLWVTAKNGREKGVGKDVSPDRLADFVGKDLADRIVRDGGGEYAGLDLRVGGEGIRAFYDKILPAVAQKLGKKWGVKVGTTRCAEFARLVQPPAPDITTYTVRDESRADVLRTTDPQEAARVRAEVAPGGTIGDELTRTTAANPRVEETPVHSIDITPEMRRSVMVDGQPLFSVAHVEGRTSELSQRAARVFQGLPLERIPGGVALRAPSGHRIIVTARGQIEGSVDAVSELHGMARVDALARGAARLAGVTLVAGRDIVVDVVDQAVLPHEAMHVFLEVFASPRERAVLQRYFDAPERAGGRHWTEAAADAYQLWCERPNALPAFVARVFERIRAFLARAEELLVGPSHRTVFEHLSRGDPFKRRLTLDPQSVQRRP